MKIAFLSYGAENLAFQYLSASLKKDNHDVKLFFDPCLFDDKLLLHYPPLNGVFSFTEWILDEIEAYSPDLIGISILTDTFPWAVEFAKAIKTRLPDVKFVVGGTHVTISTDRVAEETCFDYFVRGEGEVPLAELARSLENGDGRTDILGVWFRKGDELIKNEMATLEPDLEFFGQPDRSVYEPYMKTDRTLLAVSARGCVYTCSFCFHNAVRKMSTGKYLRRLSPEKFVEYLKENMERYNYKTLQIYDEIFTYDQDWLEKFAPLYKKEINTPYICLGHPNYMSERVIQLLKESNCFGVQIGLQSINEETRATILDRNEKSCTVEEMVNNLEKYKLPYQIDIIFGLPGDSIKDYENTVDFFSRCKSASKVNTLILSLQPKTDIVEHALNSGMITEEDKKGIDEGKEGCRVGDSGSLRDKGMYKLIMSYMLMCRIAAKFPRAVTRFLMITRLSRGLKYFEPFLGHLIRFWNIDKRDRIYVFHYWDYLTKFFRLKLKSTKAIFNIFW